MAKTQNATPETAAKTPLKIEFHPQRAFKELEKVPERHRERFVNSLYLMMNHLDPACDVKHLGESLGHGTYELIINGSPAWRVIYTTTVKGKIVVLHATEKTTNGSDRQIANVVRERLKTLRQADAKEKKQK
jgi:phage-related protein